MYLEIFISAAIKDVDTSNLYLGGKLIETINKIYG